MKAIILAAGRGSRLGVLTEGKPKCLTEIGGKTLLQWQLDALYGAGVKEIGIVRGYKAEEIRVPKVTYFENANWDKTNMVKSLLCARDWLLNDECLISYSDILYPPETIRALSAVKDEISISYNTKWLDVWQARFEDPLLDAETFCFNEQSFLTEIGGKAKCIADIKGQYMGLLKFNVDGWKKIEKILDGFDSKILDKMDMTSMLSKLLQVGVKIKTVPIEGDWFEIDSQEDIKSYLKWKER